MSFYVSKPRIRSGMAASATHSIWHGRREILSLHISEKYQDFRLLCEHTHNSKILMRAVKSAIEVAAELGHSEIYYSDSDISNELTRVLEVLGFVCVLSNATLGYKYVLSLTT